MPVLCVTMCLWEGKCGPLSLLCKVCQPQFREISEHLFPLITHYGSVIHEFI